MVTNERGQELHSRKVRGNGLTTEELTDLQAWYDEMDAAESKMLKIGDHDEALAIMRGQVSQMNARMMSAVRAVIELSEQNEQLRREKAALEQKLRHRLDRQAA